MDWLLAGLPCNEVIYIGSCVASYTYVSLPRVPNLASASCLALHDTNFQGNTRAVLKLREGGAHTVEAMYLIQLSSHVCLCVCLCTHCVGEEQGHFRKPENFVISGESVHLVGATRWQAGLGSILNRAHPKPPQDGECLHIYESRSLVPPWTFHSASTPL